MTNTNSRRIDSTLPIPTAGQRLSVIMSRLCGVVIDPIMACPNVNAGVLEFACTVAQGDDIVTMMRDDGVADVRSEIHAEDPADVFAVVYIPMAAMTARIGG
jgi:hypothetical protein